MSSHGNFSLFINPKWKNSELYQALTKIQFRSFFDDSLTLLDFRTAHTGFVYIEPPKIVKTESKQPQAQTEKSTDQLCSEYRKHLAKIHNVGHSNLHIQTLMDSKNRELYNSIQEFCIIELKIQVIPVDSVLELAQYIERLMLIECQDEKNPFLKESIFDTNDKTKTSEIYMNCLRAIPKVGEKNAQILFNSYKSLRSLSNATLEDLTEKLGRICAKSVYDYFNLK